VDIPGSFSGMHQRNFFIFLAPVIGTLTSRTEQSDKSNYGSIDVLKLIRKMLCFNIPMNRKKEISA
jgi:hypothetical protein